MDDRHAERMIQLLEELCEGQRLQLERHAETIGRMEERLAEQRERSVNLAARNEQIFAETQGALKRARPLVLISLSVTVACLSVLMYVLVVRFVS
jgi:hypothetical protein